MELEPWNQISDEALETWEEDWGNLAILQPLPKPETAKQRKIRETRPWEVSRIVRSKSYKQLLEKYRELYYRNVAGE